MKRLGLTLLFLSLAALAAWWWIPRDRPILSLLSPSKPVEPKSTGKKFVLPIVVDDKPQQSEVDKIAASLRRDDMCEANGKGWMPESSSENLYLALTKVTGESADPCVLAMIQKDLKQALKQASSSNDKDCRLVRALILTGQWMQEPGAKAPPLDLAKGEEILNELKSADPGNGFYDYFLLGSGVDSGYRDFLRAKKFRNPLLEKTSRLRMMGRENSAAHTAASSIFWRMAIPDYGKANMRAKELVAAKAFLPEAKAWRDGLLKRMAREDELGLGEPATWVIEDAIFRGIAKKLPGSLPLPLQDGPWKEFYRRRVAAEIESDPSGTFEWEESSTCAEYQDFVRRNFARYHAETDRMLDRWRASELY